MTTENRAVVQSLADAWAAREVITGFVGMAESIVFETLNEVSDGNLVLNERVDTFVIGGNPTAIKVMGTFELRDGKIARWRDYFDMSALTGG